MNCKCPFCKKPKFNIEDYFGNVVMHCSTQKEAEIFCGYLHSLGRTWYSGSSYEGNIKYHEYGSKTCYEFLINKYDELEYFIFKHYRILEFDDFDWSDFMKKEFTKADLKNGDVVKRRNGDIEIVCVDTGTMIRNDGAFNGLSCIRNNLTDTIGKEFDIIAVRRPIDTSDCRFSAFDDHRGSIVYVRKEVEEMTLEEVCKALGKEIKIVKSK